ncbi:hypothetical protein L1049_010846 [Liquidambar formosana]|uniref:Uncharacterized protein n=1 Tax=Liquidambar formosana TaxID=63359 RepID=A0AAP0RQ48_LIQFO
MTALYIVDGYSRPDDAGSVDLRQDRRSSTYGGASAASAADGSSSPSMLRAWSSSTPRCGRRPRCLRFTERERWKEKARGRGTARERVSGCVSERLAG